MIQIVLLLLVGACVAVAAYCAYAYAKQSSQLENVKKQLYFESKLVLAFKNILETEAQFRGIIREIERAKTAEDLNRIYNDIMSSRMRKERS